MSMTKRYHTLHCEVHTVVGRDFFSSTRDFELTFRRVDVSLYEFYAWSIFDAKIEDFDKTIDVDEQDVDNNYYIATNGQDRQIIDSMDKMKCFVVRLVLKEKNKEKVQMSINW